MLGLVLGGGAAKGYAHIGVLKVLEQEGIQPDLVVGASMGALVGGFYAAGYNAKTLEEIALGIDKKKKRWLFTPHISRKGFISGRNVIKYIFPYLHGKVIEELPIKFAAVTTDIEHHQEIIHALRTPKAKAPSCSFPLPVFRPDSGRSVERGPPRPRAARPSAPARALTTLHTASRSMGSRSNSAFSCATGRPPSAWTRGRSPRKE